MNVILPGGLFACVYMYRQVRLKSELSVSTETAYLWQTQLFTIADGSDRYVFD